MEGRGNRWYIGLESRGKMEIPINKRRPHPFLVAAFIRTIHGADSTPDRTELEISDFCCLLWRFADWTNQAERPRT